jgi:hypothetical protein
MAVAAATSGGWCQHRGDRGGGWSIAVTDARRPGIGRVMRPGSFGAHVQIFIQILLNRHVIDKTGNNIARHDLIWCE